MQSDPTDKSWYAPIVPLSSETQITSICDDWWVKYCLQEHLCVSQICWAWQDAVNHLWPHKSPHSAGCTTHLTPRGGLQLTPDPKSHSHTLNLEGVSMPQVVLAKKDHPFMQLCHLLTLHNSHPQRHTHAGHSTHTYLYDAVAIIIAHQANPTCDNVVVYAWRKEAKSWFLCTNNSKNASNPRKCILELSFKSKQGCRSDTNVHTQCYDCLPPPPLCRGHLFTDSSAQSWQQHK